MDSNTVTPRCKVGDWALVIRPDHPENAGRVVRIVRPASPDEFCNWRKGEATWWVRAEGSPLRECYDDMTTELAQETCMHDMRLLPIWWETSKDIETAALIAGVRTKAMSMAHGGR